MLRLFVFIVFFGFVFAEDTLPTVTATLETQTVLDMDETPNGERRGDADDIAIWVHPTDVNKSVVVGVLKDGGLEVYDLNGQVLQSINPEGVRYNNVDLVYGVAFAGEQVDIVVATDRYKDRLVIFTVNPETGELTDITAKDAPLLFTPEGQESDEETTAYGIALYKDEAGKLLAFVNRRDTGDLAQVELLEQDGGMTYQTVDTFFLPIPEGGELGDAQTEGMVVDPELGFLYIGQENVGVWKKSLEQGSEPTLIHAIDDEILFADVEGLTIYYADNGTGYLLVSSQGNNSYAVYSREGDNDYLGSFQIAANGDIDSAEESDGAMVLNVPLGNKFSNGILIVQDGQDEPFVEMEDEGEMEIVSANFKYVDWAQVANAFNPPLKIDTTSHQVR
jgi:myo-inositol-hexaphosphate 3-phosphohydrolase